MVLRMCEVKRDNLLASEVESSSRVVEEVEDNRLGSADLQAMEGGGCSEMEEDCKSSSSGTSSSTTSIPILGVEIDPTSINLEKEPFTTSTCFMMGNEGSGMTTKQMSVCDGFIRISQYGGGTASLNVSVACGIVLHRFHCWSRKQSISG